MHDGWMYQGRQSHGWFGHGTGPAKPPPNSAERTSGAILEQRIHDLGHTLLAGLPRSKRDHDAATLGVDDHARLDRLLTAVVHALPLGLPAIAQRILNKAADAPGVGSFVQAAALLRDGRDYADLRAATDALGQAAQEIGLDRFKPFLRQADEHLAVHGGLLTLVRDMPHSASPLVEAPTEGPILPMLGRASLGAAVLAFVVQMLPRVVAEIERGDVEDTIKRFGLDTHKPEDVAAAYSFLWAEKHGPWLFDTPQTGPDMLAMAEQVMRTTQADPELFRQLVNGDAGARGAFEAAVKAPVPGSGIKTRTDDERTLVLQMVQEGKSPADIQMALNLHRAGGRTLTTKKQRNLPGFVIMSTSLPRAEGPWLTAGLHRDDGVAIPGQVAQKLVGQRFSNFDDLRAAIWKLIAQTPELAGDFEDDNLQLMRAGRSPYPPRREQVTVQKTGQLTRRRYELHHDPAIGEGGKVYDLSKIRIVTPRQHDVLGREMTADEPE